MTKLINPTGDGGGIAKGRRRRPLHILTAHDLEKLTLFYLGLDFDGRRGRFGAGVSGQSIARYCQTLDWHRSIILGRTGGYFFDAILEIHPLSPGWGTAEIVLTCPLLCETSQIFSQLIQLAALLAGQKSCHTFLVGRDHCCRDTIELLRSIGKPRSGINHLAIDLGDYTLAAVRPTTKPDRANRPQLANIQISAGELNHANVHLHPRKRSTDVACGSRMSG
jgi:hypothetical protein